MRYPIVKRVNSQSVPVAEVAQSSVDMELIRAMQAAKKVQFKLCELERSLDLAGVQALDGFADEFVMRAPPGTLPPSQQSVEPIPAPVEESVTPAQ